MLVLGERAYGYVDDADRDNAGDDAVAAHAGGGACEALPARFQDRGHAGDAHRGNGGVHAPFLHGHDRAHASQPDAAIGSGP